MNLLQIGDVFAVQVGMKVYFRIPGKFLYSNVYEGDDRANVIGQTDVTIGEKLKSRTKDKVNHPVSTIDTGTYAGDYVVTKTSTTGGGNAHGSGDSYPDGHHITARKLAVDGTFDPNGFVITFYQTGAFTVVNRDVPVIRKMTMTFVGPKTEITVTEAEVRAAFQWFMKDAEYPCSASAMRKVIEDAKRSALEQTQ